MAFIDRTAYPRLGKRLSASELEEQYTISGKQARLVRLLAIEPKCGHMSAALLTAMMAMN